MQRSRGFKSRSRKKLTKRVRPGCKDPEDLKVEVEKNWPKE